MKNTILIYCLHTPTPKRELRAQRHVVDLGVLDHLDGPSDLGIPVGVRLAVLFHLAQRGPEGLVGGGRVTVLQTLAVPEHETGGGWAGWDDEFKVRPGGGGVARAAVSLLRHAVHGVFRGRLDL
jgi:hypothetical protein